MGDVSEMLQTQETFESTLEKEQDASADTEKLESTERNHLVVLVHGLHGASTDLIAIKDALEAANLDIVVHCASCNDGFLFTHDGIDKGGTRLANEICDLLTDKTQITRISIIGHSLGGMYSRYCVGVLHERGFFQQIKPENLITIATPHVGSRRPPNGFFNHAALLVTRNAFSITGKQLMVEDQRTEGPILLEMSRPESKYFKALELFSTRILFANVANDIQVNYSTAAILPCNPHTKGSTLSGSVMVFKEFDHKVFLETLSEEEFFRRDAKREILVEILKNLQQLEWKRIDVYLNSFWSHEKIVMKRKWMGQDAKEIIDLIVDQFSD